MNRYHNRYYPRLKTVSFVSSNYYAHSNYYLQKMLLTNEDSIACDNGS